ncbi:hypothetical protein D3C72_2042920 [compost metagenome]
MLAFDRFGDLAALGLVDGADFQHGIDEKAQPFLRWRPSGRGMRRRDQPEIFKIGHHIAHRGGRQPRLQHAG